MQHRHMPRFRRTASVTAPATAPDGQAADLPSACVPDRRLPWACPAARVGGPATARRGAAGTPRGAR